MKIISKILLVVFFVGFLFVLIPADNSFADTCSLTGASWSAGSATTNMSSLKNGDRVNLNVSGAPEGGAAQGCKDFNVNFRIYKEKCSAIPIGEGASTTICDIDPSGFIASLDGKFDSAGNNATVTWTINVSGATTRFTQLLFTATAGDETKTSASSIQVATGLTGSKVYACIVTDASGNQTYKCSTPPENATSSCREVPFNDCTNCQQIDKANCDKAVGAVATHKECRNNACSIIPGPGVDSCGVNADCAGSGPGGGTFVLPNPIGITTFEELVGIIGTWIFNLAIPIAVIIIIYAGMMMLTAGGNPARFAKGSKALWYAVIGIAVVLIGKGFVTLVQSILGQP